MRDGETLDGREATVPLDSPDPGPPPEGGVLPRRDRGRYRLLEEHARGGLGRVWKAHDLQLDRIVAVKEMLVTDTQSHVRFLREALITGRLEHPSIVPVHEAGWWASGEPFYVMKLVSGRTLADLVRERGTLRERLELLPRLIAVADAIAYAHAQGVLHRDLKPPNVIAGDFGETVVIDWGLAKDLRAGAAESAPAALGDHDLGATVEGEVIGTPSYMPPEQARGEAVDERADVYALGAILYTVLSGRAPISGATTAEVLRRLLDRGPAPLAEVEPGAPSDLVAIVDKAMARDRADRYPTALELARDLTRFQTGQLVSAHRYTSAQRVARWVRRNRRLAVAISLFVVAAVAGTSAFVVREQRLRRVAEQERERAEAQTLALLEQQGRAELASGNPFRAAVYLVEALQRDPSSTPLRSLVSEAIRPMERLERSLEGHATDITGAAYSRDGTRLVTASGGDARVRVWDPERGQRIAEFTLGNVDYLNDAALSPDGRFVATAAADGIHLHRADTGAAVWHARGGWTRVVLFTPDGTRLLSATLSPAELESRDVQTGELLGKVAARAKFITDVAIAPDGRQVALAQGLAAPLIVSADLQPLLSLSDDQEFVRHVAYSPDGRWLLTVTDDAVHVRRASTGERAHTFHMPPRAGRTQARYLPDGQAIVTFSQDGVVRTWHATSGVLLDAFDAEPSKNLWTGALRHDGAQLVTGATAGSLHLWRFDRPGWRILGRPQEERAMLYHAEYTADGRRAFAGDDDGVVSEWDPRSGARLSTFKAPHRVVSLALTGEGRRVAAVHDDSVTPGGVWEPATAQKVASLDAAGDVAASRDGTFIATANRDGGVHLYDGASGAPLAELRIDSTVKTAVAIRPDGRELAVTTGNGLLYLIERASGRVVRVIPAHPEWPVNVAYSPDGQRIVTAGWKDHVAKVFEAATGRPLLTLPHPHLLMSATFSPDGRWIATAGTGKQGMLWSADDGKLLRTIEGPTGVAFDPSGHELLTTGPDGYAVIWDVRLDRRTPEELAAFVAERSPWQLVEGVLRPREPAR